MEKTKKEKKRSPFSINEDQKLISLVEKYGENLSAWKCIASNMEGRNARQCRERYKLFLSDEFKKKVKWTKEEDNLLLSKYALYGSQWKSMESYFKGRTSNSIRNRYSCLQRHIQKEKYWHEERQSNETMRKNEINKDNLNNSKTNDINLEVSEKYYDDIFQNLPPIEFNNMSEYFYDF